MLAPNSRSDFTISTSPRVHVIASGVSPFQLASFTKEFAHVLSGPFSTAREKINESWVLVILNGAVATTAEATPASFSVVMVLLAALSRRSLGYQVLWILRNLLRASVGVLARACGRAWLCLCVKQAFAFCC